MPPVDGWMTGVLPVLEVPFAEDESLDVEGFGRMLDHVAGTGVTGVMFPGFASEFHKLSESERALLTGLLLEVTSASGVGAVVAVQDHATRLAVARASDAVETGASAINLLPPFQLGPSPAAVRHHVRAVLAAVDPVPVVLQHAPAQTGASLDAATISRLAGEHGNLAAVKVESTPPGRMIAALAAGDPPVPALVGYAGLQLPDAIRRGAVGVQPGCSFTELYLAVWNRWHDGDVPGAEALHGRMVPYLSYWMQSVELIVAVEKLISVRRGWFASATCRAPAYTLDEIEIDQVDAFLADVEEELDAR